MQIKDYEVRTTRDGFIGGGNMSGAIVGGLLNNNYPAELISVSEPNLERQQQLNQLYKGIKVTNNTLEAVDKSSLVVLGVKPNVTKQVMKLDGFSNLLNQQNSILLSLVAGIKIDSIKKWLKIHDKISIIRCMPNTPSLVGDGAIGLYHEHYNKELYEKVESILTCIAKKEGIIWTNKESLMDSITAISGSGPAYFFYMIECMEKQGVELGLDALDARKLATITMSGAAKMLINQTFDDQLKPEDLRKRVTSPNGTTHAAIQQFIKDDFEKVVRNALNACYHRSKQIGDEMGSQ